MIDPARIQPLVECEPRRARSTCVLYWMQASQRTRSNHALEYAISLADALELPLAVCFGLMDDYPEANARHYAFMLEGLADVHANLAARGIAFVIKKGNPADVAIHYARRAAAVVCDRGYLRHQKQWREQVAAHCQESATPLTQVESDVVVPAGVASNKREFAARTIRPRIHRKLDEFLRPLPTARPRNSADSLDLRGDLDPADPAALLKRLNVDPSVPPVPEHFIGGENEARRRLKRFVQKALTGFAERRNEPAADGTSHLAAYLHFGHVSPVEIALAIRDSAAPAADRDSYLEELIVRRELGINYCHYTENYDSYDALPGWAKKTLAEHANDPRPYTYTRAELEAAQTHDPYWNAAQNEMNRTGFMHNYMRMYWGKKILEWTADPREAFETTLHLNNKLFLCGRDPLSYSNVAWIYGLHDRPWGPARKIFGTVRYMNAAGLERKFDIDAYVERIARLGGG